MKWSGPLNNRTAVTKLVDTYAQGEGIKGEGHGEGLLIRQAPLEAILEAHPMTMEAEAGA